MPHVLLLLSLPLFPYSGDSAALAENYVNLEVSTINLSGVVRLAYSCDFSTYDFQGVPVDIYIAALRNPIISAGPSSIADLFSSSGVQLFRPGMQSTYAFTGRLAPPAFSNITFPPAPGAGAIAINTIPADTFCGNYAYAAIFTCHGTADFIRTDGLPAAVSNTFAPFRYHAAVLDRTIHVGDGYDPYMANWEVPYPDGMVVERTFLLDPPPGGTAALRGDFWGTYYTNNPLFINKLFVGYIPGQLNGNHWNRSSFPVPRSFFRRGKNLITFKCSPYKSTGHWDDYMTKGWELFYN